MTRYVLFVIALVLASSGFAQDEELPIQRLNWLIGEWKFDDEAVNGEYRETGTRNCDWILNDRYIRCTGTGINHRGKERDYNWYFNYNHMEERFEMTALFGDWPRKNLYVIDVSADNHTLELESFFFTHDGLTPNNSATVTYNGTDSYVWRIRSGDPDPETGVVPVSFIDSVERVQ